MSLSNISCAEFQWVLQYWIKQWCLTWSCICFHSSALAAMGLWWKFATSLWAATITWDTLPEKPSFITNWNVWAKQFTDYHATYFSVLASTILLTLSCRHVKTWTSRHHLSTAAFNFLAMFSAVCRSGMLSVWSKLQLFNVMTREM